MHIFADSELKKVTGLRKLPPVYYIGHEVVADASEALIDETIDTDEVSDSRPFDEMLLLAVDAGGASGLTLLVHFLADGSYRNFMHRDGKWTNTTVRENISESDDLMSYMLDLAKRDIKADAEMVQANKAAMVAMLLPFSMKKTVIHLEETAVASKRENSNKMKRTRQRYIRVGGSNANYIRSKSSGLMSGRSFPATTVCGHWRVFHKNPETVGKNRHGDLEIGKTWVSPYKRGDGKEIANKIRLWLNNGRDIRSKQ